MAIVLSLELRIKRLNNYSSSPLIPDTLSCDIVNIVHSLELRIKIIDNYIYVPMSPDMRTFPNCMSIFLVFSNILYPFS